MLRAGTPLRPGDAIVLLDGTYTRDTTGLPDIDCRPGGTAPNGAPGRPIVLRAQNERRAHLAADGATDAFQMRGCARWRVRGLYGSNADGTAANPSDGHVFEVSDSEHVTLQRLLAVHPNRRCPNDTLPTCNAHAIRVERSRHVLVEDVEAYDFHRHGVSVSGSRWVTVRRCYLHPRGAPGGLSGSTALIFYGASDSIAENCVAEHTLGFNVAGTGDAGGTAGGYRNRLLGLVALDNDYGSTIRARNFGGPVRPVGDTVVRDSVFARSAKVGVYSRGAAGTLLANVTIVGTRGDGFVADEDRGERAPCSANPRGCSIVARKVLSLANRGKGAQIDEGVVSSWRIESSTLAGNEEGDFPTAEDPRDGGGHIRHSSSVRPLGVGLAARGMRALASGRERRRHWRHRALPLSERDPDRRAAVGPRDRRLSVRGARAGGERRPGQLLLRRSSAPQRERQRVRLPAGVRRVEPDRHAKRSARNSSSVEAPPPSNSPIAVTVRTSGRCCRGSSARSASARSTASRSSAASAAGS